MTKRIRVGNLTIGGGAAVSVQSMTNTDTSDIAATVAQIKRLTAAGCELVRVSVPDEQSARAIKPIRAEIDIPLCVDIHFDYKLAVLSDGADKVRINPSNIGSRDKVEYLAQYLKERNVPIRIGANLGSIKKRDKEPAVLLSECALEEVAALEHVGFEDIIVSAKASDVMTAIRAYELLSKQISYPLHIGVTEAGAGDSALVKASIACGKLLADGIGDTIRVSMVGDPVNEVIAARRILNSLGLRRDMPEVIACPTCARTNIDVAGISAELEKRLTTEHIIVKAAVMGCVVNGIGESKDADFGVAGGKGKSALFSKGEVLKTVDNEEILNELMLLAEKYR